MSESKEKDYLVFKNLDSIQAGEEIFTADEKQAIQKVFEQGFTPVFVVETTNAITRKSILRAYRSYLKSLEERFDDVFILKTYYEEDGDWQRVLLFAKDEVAKEIENKSFRIFTKFAMPSITAKKNNGVQNDYDIYGIINNCCFLVNTSDKTKTKFIPEPKDVEILKTYDIGTVSNGKFLNFKRKYNQEKHNAILSNFRMRMRGEVDDLCK